MGRLELYSQLLYINSCCQLKQIYQVLIILQASVFPFQKMEQRPTTRKLCKVEFKGEH